MRKILLTLILLILFIPGVNAEELTMPMEGMGISNSCSKNLLNADFSKFTYINSYWGTIDPTSTSKAYIINTYFIPVEPNTTYYYSSNFKIYTFFYEYDENLNEIINYQKWNNSSLTTKENTRYMNIGFYTNLSNLSDSNYFQFELGDTGTEIVAYEECTIAPPIEEPTIEPDTTLDSFYVLYIDKMKSLANYATENKFILTAIGIILLFVILEIILNLFGKGGYRK